MIKVGFTGETIVAENVVLARQEHLIIWIILSSFMCELREKLGFANVKTITLHKLKFEGTHKTDSVRSFSSKRSNLRFRTCSRTSNCTLNHLCFLSLLSGSVLLCQTFPNKGIISKIESPFAKNIQNFSVDL